MESVEVLVEGSSQLEVFSRRKFVALEINHELRFINVHYKEEKFHAVDGEETILSSVLNSYSSNYDDMESSSIGQSIKSMIEARLAYPDPQNPPTPE